MGGKTILGRVARGALAAASGATCSSARGAPSAAGADAGDDAGAPPVLPPFLTAASVFVDGHAYDDDTRDCRTEMCRRPSALRAPG